MGMGVDNVVKVIVNRIRGFPFEGADRFWGPYDTRGIGQSLRQCQSRGEGKLPRVPQKMIT